MVGKLKEQLNEILIEQYGYIDIKINLKSILCRFRKPKDTKMINFKKDLYAQFEDHPSRKIGFSEMLYFLENNF